MKKGWQDCKSLLIIRPDNMGDLIMSGPAIRALKDTFKCRITLLTSSMGAIITPFLNEIDETIVFDLPWVKAKEVIASEVIFDLVQQLKERNFDAAVIFTVFSQNPLPSAMIAYMAGIPSRLAYCRENPYELLTNWVPDKEPYTFIQHQVERDLKLVETVGAFTKNRKLQLQVPDLAWENAKTTLIEKAINLKQPWLIFHPGVSEKKRQYPASLWVKAARKVVGEKGFQVIFTGSVHEKDLCETLASQTGNNAFSIAGLLNLSEFLALVKEAPLVVSVNTGTVHIAAAVNTPVVVLYAQTNPQHTPWMIANRVLEFAVEEADRSKNDVIQYLHKELYKEKITMPTPNDIVAAISDLLNHH